MTKTDLVMLAGAVRCTLAHLGALRKGTKFVDLSDVEEVLLNEMTRVGKARNPRFDEDRFRRACLK